MVFEHLDLEYDVRKIKYDYEERAKRDYTVESGEYTAILQNIETKVTMTGKPMITAQFKLNTNSYYYNFMIHDGRGLYYYIRFLKQLIKNQDKDQLGRLTFENYDQLEKLTQTMLQLYQGQIYKIRIGKSKNNYDTLEIME